MSVQQDRVSGLDQVDEVLIDDALAFVSTADIDGVLSALAPRLTAGQRESVARHCMLAHAAALISPSSVDELIAGLRAGGLAVADAVPSVVVRQRLSDRHGVPVDRLNVSIVDIGVHASDGSPCEVELFTLEVPPGSEFVGIAAKERAELNESHVALDVRAPDPVVLIGMSALLTGDGGLVADGGGYNGAENCTVLYFRNPGGASPYRRLELRVRGHHPRALEEHLTNDPDPARRLLELMTGAWATQAIAVSAELRLVDHLPGAVEGLAEILAVHPDGLSRLLRYLASLGIIVPAAEGYQVTALGERLRSDARHSLRPLALMYGGPFYQSFGSLGEAVRTGHEAFETVFGQGHFGYFSDRPQLAELFDESMAASLPMFEVVPGLVDFSDAHVVVDIAGGTGALLGQILGHAPHLRGVLFDRADVVERARHRLAGLGDRCDFVAGDFTRSVPDGGDVYLLSRILHDWEDEYCLAILRRCASAIPPGGQLLLVERLLTTDGTPCLAAAWDLHMLCNVGGRERTAGHYARLLSATGFDLVTISALPLDGSLLQARRLGLADRPSGGSQA